MYWSSHFISASHTNSPSNKQPYNTCILFLLLTSWLIWCPKNLRYRSKWLPDNSRAIATCCQKALMALLAHPICKTDWLEEIQLQCFMSLVFLLERTYRVTMARKKSTNSGLTTSKIHILIPKHRKADLQAGRRLSSYHYPKTQRIKSSSVTREHLKVGQTEDLARDILSLLPVTITASSLHLQHSPPSSALLHYTLPVFRYQQVPNLSGQGQTWEGDQMKAQTVVL